MTAHRSPHEPRAHLEPAGNELFLCFDGNRIARRGRPGTREARTWVSLEPGWQVQDLENGQIEVRRYGTLMKH